MLEQHDSQPIIDFLWSELPMFINLPEDSAHCGEKRGQSTTHWSDQRKHPRFFYGQKAIVVVEQNVYAAYTWDLSRSGISFLHHAQLFPGDEATILLGSQIKIRAEIRRCRRRQKNCYDCGAQMIQVDRLDFEQFLDQCRSYLPLIDPLKFREAAAESSSSVACATADDANPASTV